MQASAAATRRDRQRVSTVAEIKAAAWADMRRSGPHGISLRAVARELGMAPSALYRYFASRDDLLTALIIDTYDELADALQAAYDQTRQDNSSNAADTFVTVAQSYRRWALDNPLRYQLVFGTSIPGYTGTDQTTAASLRSSAILLRIMRDMVDERAVDLAAVDRLMTDDLAQRFGAWSEATQDHLPRAALMAAMLCYVALHGAINLEVNHHFPQPLSGSDDFFATTMRAVVDRISVGRTSVNRSSSPSG
ncbi:MAG: TetR/AcrR family transcriptional regulator [bacterium]